MRERNIPKNIEVSIVCYYVLGIGNNGAIYKFVVIWIRVNQTKSKLRINPYNIVRTENCLNDHVANNR